MDVLYIWPSFFLLLGAMFLVPSSFYHKPETVGSDNDLPEQVHSMLVRVPFVWEH